MKTYLECDNCESIFVKTKDITPRFDCDFEECPVCFSKGHVGELKDMSPSDSIKINTILRLKKYKLLK